MMYLPYAAVLAAVASAASIPDVKSSNHLKLDFSVLRGNSKSTAQKGAREGLVARDGSYLLELDNQLSFYSSTLKVGSNGDESIVLVDTGSSDLWLMSSDVACYPSPLSKRYVDDFEESIVGPDLAKRLTQAVSSSASPTSTSTQSTATIDRSSCTALGSFNTEASSSFHFNSSAPAFHITYGDGTFAKGIWGSDSVSIGSFTVPDTNFAVVNDTTSSFGVFGIGLSGLEVTSAYAKPKNRYTYENFPIRLKETGVINKVAYSLYLNDFSSSSGSVLFGAVDHAKYTGELQTVPIVNIYSKRFANPIAFYVAVDSVNMVDASQNIPLSGSSFAGLLDSGTTLTYLPSTILKSIASSLNGQPSSFGYYEVDCIYNTSSANVVYNLSGAEIKVPLSDLIMTAALAGTNDSKCYLGLVDSGDNTAILGDNFLRHAYVVYDLEQYEISLAQVKYSSDENIEIISSTIPSAVKAPGYSSTSLASTIIPEPTNSHLTFATTISYWTGLNTSTTTVSPSGSIPTVVVEIPFTVTSTSTWAGSYTFTEVVTGTDGLETPVVVLPELSSSVASSSVASSSVASSSVASSSVASSSVASSSVASSSVASSSVASSSAASSLGWNSSFVSTVSYTSTYEGSASGSLNSITTENVPISSSAWVNSVSGSSISLTTATGIVVSTSTNSLGVTELITSTFTTIYCPESTAAAVTSASSASSLTTETKTIVSASTNAAGSTVFVTNTFTTTYCPESSSVASTNVGASKNLTTETRISISASTDALGSTVLITNTFTTTYCPASHSGANSDATYTSAVSSGTSSSASQESLGSSIIADSIVSSASTVSLASSIISIPTLSTVSGDKFDVSSQIKSSSVNGAAFSSASATFTGTGSVSSISAAPTSSITILQGGSPKLSVTMAILLAPILALL